MPVGVRSKDWALKLTSWLVHNLKSTSRTQSLLVEDALQPPPQRLGKVTCKGISSLESLAHGIELMRRSMPDMRNSHSHPWPWDAPEWASHQIDCKGESQGGLLGSLSRDKRTGKGQKQSWWEGSWSCVNLTEELHY